MSGSYASCQGQLLPLGNARVTQIPENPVQAADSSGWETGAKVPVDVSEAWKHPKKREYFFGANDEHRVLFSRGRDIRFNPEQADEPVNFFVYPDTELDGKPFEAVQTKFFFRDL